MKVVMDDLHHEDTYWVDWCYIGDAVTTCGITRGADPKTAQPFMVGAALIGDGDKFCKRIGRKIALTRALKPLPRHIRRIFWKRYFETCNDLRKGKP